MSENDQNDLPIEVIPAEQPRIRDEKGRLLPGVRLNPHGRPKNKITFTRADVNRILEQEDFHPIREMIRIARHPDASLYVQLEAAERIASYVLPKVKQVQITGSDGESEGVIKIQWDMPDNPSPEQIEDGRATFNAEMQNAAHTIMDGITEAVLDDDDEQC